MSQNFYTSNGNIVTTSHTFGGAGTISASYNNVDAYGTPTARSDSAELPTISMTGFDEYGNSVMMTLSPESGITAGDVSKLLMLTVAVIGGHGSGRTFNPLAYVKKHSLERHFKFA